MPAWLNWLHRLFARAPKLRVQFSWFAKFFFSLYIYNNGIRLNLNTFITILLKSKDSIWNVPWNPYGTVHMDWFIWNPYALVHMESICTGSYGIHMESIWTGAWNPYGMVYSMDNPYGIHSAYGLKKWLETQPKNSPYGIHGLGGGVHPVHMESIWNHPGTVKTSLDRCTCN